MATHVTTARTQRDRHDARDDVANNHGDQALKEKQMQGEPRTCGRRAPWGRRALRRVSALVVGAAALGLAVLRIGSAEAGPSVQAAQFVVQYSLVEELRYDVPVASSPGHWIRAAKFAGPVQGQVLDGSWAEEFGLHDVFPGQEGTGAPIYHVITVADGSTLTIRGDRRLVSYPGTEGEGPLNVYTGQWIVLNGTGSLSNAQGGGTIIVRPLSPTTIIQEFHGALRGI